MALAVVTPQSRYQFQSVNSTQKTHSVTLDAIVDSSITRFTLRDANGNPLWSGLIFSGPYQEAVNEFDSALIEAWLFDKLSAREIIETTAIHVSLKVEAQWTLHRDQGQYSTRENSAMTVMLWREDQLQRSQLQTTRENDDKEKTHARISPCACGPAPDSVRMGQRAPQSVARRARAT